MSDFYSVMVDTLLGEPVLIDLPAAPGRMVDPLERGDREYLRQRRRRQLREAREAASA